MPAVTYLSDHVVKQGRTVPNDKDCDELLQELRQATSEDWIIEVIKRPLWKRRWHRLGYRQDGERTYYTLYADCHGEWQIINVVTPQGGSVFCGASREDVMNFILGYLAGLYQAGKTTKAV